MVCPALSSWSTSETAVLALGASGITEFELAAGRLRTHFTSSRCTLPFCILVPLAPLVVAMHSYAHRFRVCGTLAARHCDFGCCEREGRSFERRRRSKRTIRGIRRAHTVGEPARPLPELGERTISSEYRSRQRRRSSACAERAAARQSIWCRQPNTPPSRAAARWGWR